MKNTLLLIIITFLFTGCSKPFSYKYQDERQEIVCSDMNVKLLNEALYSFKEDISRQYLKEISDKDYLNFSFSYAQYIYRGAEGTAPYNEIVSSYTLKVFDELKKHSNLFIKREGKSNLNYQSDFVKCLVNGIKDVDMKNKIKNLIEVDYLSPEVMAEIYRVTNADAETDANYLMFIALDTFYQRFFDIDFSKTR